MIAPAPSSESQPRCCRSPRGTATSTLSLPVPSLSAPVPPGLCSPAAVGALAQLRRPSTSLLLQLTWCRGDSTAAGRLDALSGASCSQARSASVSAEMFSEFPALGATETCPQQQRGRSLGAFCPQSPLGNTAPRGSALLVQFLLLALFIYY